MTDAKLNQVKQNLAHSQSEIVNLTAHLNKNKGNAIYAKMLRKQIQAHKNLCDAYTANIKGTLL